ncbi:MAG: hypothetical protein Q7T08_10880 [Devosia sp.]|nr:hypothetical protein [Devosia sp.]
MCNDCEQTETVIDVRMIAPRLRHPMIFSTFGIFEWTYEQQGPEIWQVRIDRLVA